MNWPKYSQNLKVDKGCLSVDVRHVIGINGIYWVIQQLCTQQKNRYDHHARSHGDRLVSINQQYV